MFKMCRFVLMLRRKENRGKGTQAVPPVPVTADFVIQKFEKISNTT